MNEKMTMNTPLISIIVPVYNMEKYLSYCLDSLMKQTYRNLEIWLIDDGSRDHSLAICQDYAARDGRFKVIHQENQGLSAARNTGLKLATGQYINFLDSDDYVDERFIETLYTNLVSGDYDFSMVGYACTYDNHSVSPHQPSQCRTFTRNELLSGLFNHLPSGMDEWNDFLFMNAWNKLYKRELIEGLYFADIKLAEDLEFNSRVFLRVRRAIYDNVKLYHYFQRRDSLVHQPVSRNFFGRIEAYHMALSYLPQEAARFRAQCSEKLIKLLLSIRYRMSHTPLDEEFVTWVAPLVPPVFREWRANSYVPARLKYGLIAFYKLPVLYRLFVAYGGNR